MEYDFKKIENYWQKKWADSGIYKVNNEFTRPKYYVLDMFPYPSGAGLHVGHPLGYIASDIFSRFKRLKGFNVLHPMGFDSFGLPAEQYAIETGQHPALTTKNNIATFKAQLNKIGFCYDWSREVLTSDPAYYKWTQWVFLQLYNSYYNKNINQAKPISELIKTFETEGSVNCQPPIANFFTASEWNQFDSKKQQAILMDQRLAFSAFGEVNWCEALGTVLANDEVVNGVSERGSHPVEKRKMRQWYLRITAYADRLLQGLETIGFSDAMKEMQKNWIGRSEGAEICFRTTPNPNPIREGAMAPELKVYTTRPDTIFGVDFMVIAPEHELVPLITTAEQHQAIETYLNYVKSRSDRERLAEAKTITGCFTGTYAINPFNNREIPIWIAEYVLAGYGTGAIMAVPCGDQRDFAFAKHFNIPITNIIGTHYNGEEANPTKEAVLENSGFLNGLVMKEAIDIAIKKIEELGIGKKQVNYRMRDAGFSRQRYWGEPFPIIWTDGIAIPLDEEELPLELPFLEKYGPGPNGEGPLANLKEWVEAKRETSTMPGYAGSSWYFLRYMDPHNDKAFCNRQLSYYWNQVDLYVGGTEHAVGHLLYSRMWTKVLYDLGHIGFDEPFKKLLNQGMITGKSYFFNVQICEDSKPGNEGEKKIISYNQENTSNVFQRFKYGHRYVDSFGKLTASELKRYNDENPSDELAEHINWLNDGAEDYILLKEESEKMSKTKFNVDNPDDIVEKYGADTFRMYEMFLGPVEASKPWDTRGIEGVHRFIRKLWRLFFDEVKGPHWSSASPTESELKILHRTIKKIEEDTEHFNFNTAVSTFMIAVNDLANIKCHKKEVLEKLLILLSPYAPHIAEELWNKLGNEETVLDAGFPEFDAKYLVETTKEYPISINGKLRTNISMALDLDQQQVEEIVLQHEIVQKWLEGKAPKKIIFVKGKMVNVVI